VNSRRANLSLSIGKVNPGKKGVKTAHITCEEHSIFCPFGFARHEVNILIVEPKYYTMKNQAFRILLILASLGLVLMSSSCDLCEILACCPDPCEAENAAELPECNPCKRPFEEQTEEEKCDCLQAKVKEREWIIYFTDSVECKDLLPIDKNGRIDTLKMIENVKKIKEGVSELDTFCQDKILFFYELAKYGVREKRENCDCQDFLFEFDSNIEVDPRTAVANAKGKLKHTGGGGVPNVDIEVGPLLIPPAIDPDTPNVGKREDNLFTVGIVDMGLDYVNQCVDRFALVDPFNKPYGLSAYNTYNCNPEDIRDFNGHGTHISGIVTLPLKPTQILDSRINDESLDFITLLSVKITQQDEIQSDLFAATCGIRKAVQKGAKVLNLSWGFYKELSSFYPSAIEEELGPLAEAIKVAKQKDVLIVTAAGNDAMNTDLCHHWPSGFSGIPGYENVISVAALAADGKSLAKFSNFGVSSVQIIAPGEDIVSLSPVIEGESRSLDADLKLSGTSMAAPFVVKLAAYHFADLTTLRPLADIPYSTLKTRILSTSEIPVLTRLGTEINMVLAPLTTPLQEKCD